MRKNNQHCELGFHLQRGGDSLRSAVSRGPLACSGSCVYTQDGRSHWQ